MKKIVQRIAALLFVALLVGLLCGACTDKDSQPTDKPTIESAFEDDSTTSNSVTVQPSTSTVTESNDQEASQTVYITPTGKRYHDSPTCGGKNSFETTLKDAKADGYTPCKKCVE